MTLDVITTGRLRLRAWTADDAPAFLDIYAHPEVYQWLGAAPAPCADEAEALRRIERWSGLAGRTTGLWAVETPGVDGVAPQPCGTVLLVTLPRSDGEPSDTHEVGWHLHPAAWGRGIATEAARALVERARAAGLTDVHAVVYEGNDRSLAVCDRLGMTRLGVTEQWYGVRLVDHVLPL